MANAGARGGRDPQADGREQAEFVEEDVARVIDGLFSRARQVDEFEYASTLLRVRGMGDPGWDPLVETGELVDDLVSLLQVPLNDHTRLRLGLLLYSHLTEVDAIYEILVNLVRVTVGERYSFDPFDDLYSPPKKPRYEQYPPSAKRVVERLAERSRAAGFQEVAGLLRWFFSDAVRNAFVHSDYVLYRDELRSREAWFIGGDGGRSQALKLTEVADLIDRAALFYKVFMATYIRHRTSYRAEKQIEGRLGADGCVVPVTLLADSERGLFGFRA